MLKQTYPYVLGLFIGIIMLPLFFLGFNLSWGSMPWLGSFMMYVGLFLWPLYVIIVLILLKTKLKADALRKKRFFLSLFLPFIGGIISLIILVLFYQTFIN